MPTVTPAAHPTGELLPLVDHGRSRDPQDQDNRRTFNPDPRSGLSLSEAALRSGLGKSTLSTLEAGSANPSVETLWALAVTYGVPLSALIVPPSPHFTVTQRTEFPMLGSDDSSYIVGRVSACPPGARRDLYYVTAEPRDVKNSEPHPPGVIEHLLLAEGKVAVKVDGQGVELEEGDYLRHRSDVPHSFEALDSDSTVISLSEA